MPNYHKTVDIKWTEAKAQAALWNELQNGNQIVVPNFTPAGWWECDMWSVTKAGYAQEHEIKLTRSDFNADAKKFQIYGSFVERHTGRGEHVTKYAAMAAATHDACPKQFWYVTPKGMLYEDEIPEWAGLKELSGKWSTRVIKQAPVLHKKKARVSDIEKARTAFYYRFWRLKMSAAWK